FRQPPCRLPPPAEVLTAPAAMSGIFGGKPSCARPKPCLPTGESALFITYTNDTYPRFGFTPAHYFPRGKKAFLRKEKSPDRKRPSIRAGGVQTDVTHQGRR